MVSLQSFTEMRGVGSHSVTFHSLRAAAPSWTPAKTEYFGAGQADGADEKPKPVLLMGKDFFNIGADRGFGGVGPRCCLRHRLALGFGPVNWGREHPTRQPLLVALRAIGLSAQASAPVLPELTICPRSHPSATDAEVTAISRMKP